MTTELAAGREYYEQAMVDGRGLPFLYGDGDTALLHALYVRQYNYPYYYWPNYYAPDMAFSNGGDIFRHGKAICLSGHS